MDAAVRTDLDRNLQGFGSEIRWGGTMREVLEADGFDVTHARRVVRGSWMLRATPPQAMQEGFGLAPEILLIVVQGEVQARDLQRAANEVVRSDMRLDGNLVVVTDGFMDLQGRLDRIPGHGQRVAWIWNYDGDERWPPLSEVLRQRLPTYDAFDEHDPIRGNQLIGREAEVARLRTRISRGDAVGVFGLRKMGKTSLARAVTDSLDPASGIREPDEEGAASRTCVVWIDAQTLDRATVDDVGDAMLVALRRRMRAAGLRFEKPARAGLAGLKSAAEALLEDKLRLCFVIDEYDYLFQPEGDLAPVQGLSRLFRLLRGWAQEAQGEVSLVLIGRDPEHLSTAQLDGVSNPLLAWFAPMWLGPLHPPSDARLLRRLGRRVGLKVGNETAELARRWTGGHPMLHRQFGSALREEVRLHFPDDPWNVRTDSYCDRAVGRFLERNAVLDIQREIIWILSKRYLAAYELLLRIVESGDVEAALKLSGGLHGPAARVLRNFGLLDEASLTVPMHLSWYVRTLLPAPMQAVG